MGDDMTKAARTGAEILVDALIGHGADHAFCVPGESFLAVLDAFVGRDIGVTVCRHESGAAIMAEAAGKMTGKPGIAFVTRGPGATNASAGVHIAFQDSTPMILFIGQVGRDQRDREAFQEVDYRAMFGPLAKWAAEIDDPARVPEYVSRAFHIAVSGRPGPVVLALPEDMLREHAEATDVRPARAVAAHPASADMDTLADLLSRAERPFVIAGGGGWDGNAARDLRAFAEAWELPVGLSLRCQDYMSGDSASYAGHVGIGIDPQLAARVKEADVLLVLGARLGEMTTSGYTLVTPPDPEQVLIHAHASADEIGHVYRPALGLAAGAKAMTAALANLAPPRARPWAERTQEARAGFLAWSQPVPNAGPVQMAEVVRTVGEMVPEDAIVSNGAGNYTAWVHRFHRFRHWRTQLAPTSGSMGYGLPAAVGAKRVAPERTVVNFAGDGCFLMTGQEMATAAKYGLGLVTVVVNNSMYGTIRMHQEKAYPGRVSATDLTNPDFAALARAYGGHGETVERTEEFAPAFRRALDSGGPAIVEVRLDPEAILPAKTLAEIRGTQAR